METRWAISATSSASRDPGSKDQNNYGPHGRAHLKGMLPLVCTRHRSWKTEWLHNRQGLTNELKDRTLQYLGGENGHIGKIYQLIISIKIGRKLVKFYLVPTDLHVTHNVIIVEPWSSSSWINLDAPNITGHSKVHCSLTWWGLWVEAAATALCPLGSTMQQCCPYRPEESYESKLRSPTCNLLP